MIGARGVERIVEVTLDRDEKRMFTKSVRAVRGLVQLTEKLSREAAKASRAKARKAAVDKTSARKKAAPKKNKNPARRGRVKARIK